MLLWPASALLNPATAGASPTSGCCTVRFDGAAAQFIKGMETVPLRHLPSPSTGLIQVVAADKGFGVRVLGRFLLLWMDARSAFVLFLRYSARAGCGKVLHMCGSALIGVAWPPCRRPPVHRNRSMSARFQREEKGAHAFAGSHPRYVYQHGMPALRSALQQEEGGARAAHSATRMTSSDCRRQEQGGGRPRESCCWELAEWIDLFCWYGDRSVTLSKKSFSYGDSSNLGD